MSREGKQSPSCSVLNSNVIDIFLELSEAVIIWLQLDIVTQRKRA